MMVKSSSVYFDAVDIEATAALSAAGAVDYFDHPSMSLCGHLLDEAETEEDVHRIFSEHIVTFNFFRANPGTILSDPNLRFLVDGKLALRRGHAGVPGVSSAVPVLSAHERGRGSEGE